MASTKPTENPPKLPLKQQTYALLRQEGLSNKEACEAVGYKESNGYQVAHKLKKYDLVDTKMVSAAHKSFKKLLKGEGVGTADKVKDSTVLAATQMVFDRVQPIVKVNHNLNVNAKVDPVDLSEYMSR